MTVATRHVWLLSTHSVVGPKGDVRQLKITALISKTVLEKVKWDRKHIFYLLHTEVILVSCVK